MRRILHIVGGMNRGGVETWLIHVLRHIDRAQYQMDFLVHTTEPCAYDEEILSLGSQIIPCMHPSKPLTYAKKLNSILRNGHYDVVHSHVHHYSGWILRTAAQAGVSVRIAHSHSDTSMLQARSSLLRQGYFRLLTKWIHQYATQKLSASGLAAQALFKNGWQSDPHHSLLHYGIDVSRFSAEIDGATLRADLGISADTFVIGHVGRFVEPKNHPFLIEIAQEVCRKHPNTCFLLVGDGPLRSQIERQVTQLGLNEYVVFAGLRDDVPALMLGVMNGFLFPSLYEGLPVTLIEAQAAGLPAVISDVISTETDLIKPLLKRMSLNQPASEWAAALGSFWKDRELISQSEAYNSVAHSDFNIEHSVNDLVRIYNG